MDLSLFIFLLVAPLNILIGFLVLKRGAKNRQNYNFAGLTFCISLWTLGLFLFQYFDDYNVALLGVRLSFAAVVLLAVFFLNFSIQFPHRVAHISKPLTLLFLLPALILMVVSLFSDLVVKKIEFFDWGANAIYGIGYYGFMILFASYILLGLIILGRRYFRVSGIAKYQMKYLFVGFTISVIIGSTTNLFIPAVFGLSKFSKFGPLATIFLAGFTFYAIIRHRFLDIRLVIKKSTTYLVSILLVLLATAVFYWFLYRFASEFLHRNAPYIGFVGLLVGLVIFLPILDYVRRLADKIMFREVYDYQRALRDLSEKITTIILLDDLIDSILDVVVKTMHVDKVGVLLRLAGSGPFRTRKTVGFKKKNTSILIKEGFFTNYLHENKKPLVLEELRIIWSNAEEGADRDTLTKVIAEMEKIKASLILPLIARKELIGFIVLGSKIGNEAYTHEDIELLTVLSNQASIAITNAKLYNEMEKMVKVRTKELDHKNKKLRKANKDLIEMNQMKSEFLTIASHQLRTPLSAAWGFLSLLQDGTLDGESEKEKKKVYKMIYDAMSRLNNIVNDLLDAMELDNRTIAIRKKSLELEPLIHSVIKELAGQSKKQGVDLVVDLEENLPKIKADKRYLTEVIMNLVDNAIKYTPKNKHKSVTIKAVTIANQLVITVTDQGIGVPKNEIKKLFDKFKRASNAKTIHTDGSGLGLYIAKKVIAGHGGEISLDSPGKDKGTTITIKLPIE